MIKIIVLSLWVFFMCTVAMAASDSEAAREFSAEHPLSAPPSAPVANRTIEEGEVARIKTFVGTVTISRSRLYALTTKVIHANKDEKIYIGDTIKTGEHGSVGITFRDNTLLSLGPDSVVVIREFLFAPAQGKLSIVTRIIKGTAAYLSGVIAKLSPQSVRFETPVATVGFRGTKFLVKIDEETSN